MKASATRSTNAVAARFFATPQTAPLDRRSWTSRRQLARAIFEYIEVFYTQQRRHWTLDMHTPITYTAAAPTSPAVDQCTTPNCPENRGNFIGPHPGWFRRISTTAASTRTGI